MGWAGGSQLADEIWRTVKTYVPKKKQKLVAKKLIDIFENEDCDTMCESVLWDIAEMKDPWEDEEE